MSENKQSLSIVHLLKLIEISTNLVLEVIEVKRGHNVMKLIPEVLHTIDFLKELPDLTLEIKDLDADEIRQLLEKSIESLIKLISSR